MILINTSMPRSGTLALCRFYLLFGIDSRHQDMSCIRRESDFVKYNLDYWPLFINDYLKKMETKEELKNPENNYFNSDWAVCCAMYPLFKVYKHIRFMVTIRHITDTCNSLRRLRWKDYHPNIDINIFAEAYINIYEFIYEQCERIEPKPYLLQFNKLVNNIYNRKLLKLFDIPASEKNIRKADKHWEYKHNCVGDYEKQNIRKDLLDKYYLIKNKLEDLCQPL